MAVPGSSRNSDQLTVRIILFCALAATATTLLPLATDSCTHSLSRSILSATGLDAYLLSCAGDAAASEAPLFTLQGNNTVNKTGAGGAARRPIMTDQLCVKGEFPAHAIPPLQCCPPTSASDPVDFTFPDPTEPLRTRWPVHVAGAEYMDKYARAVALMNPRSFYQQANLHCAYCTGAHRQVGHPELGVEIHFSWLFFPFHRAYLYFFERIAAKLLGDPGFALPVWSWDVPEGMVMPEVFTDEASPLYDPIREPSHAPPKVADLDFFVGDEKNLTDEQQQIMLNLRVMHRQMVSGAALPSLFLGQPYRAGDPSMPGPGTVELAPHNTMHSWVGNNSRPNLEDMGTYYSAGRDPLFHPHHANIDRLWECWRRIVTGNRTHEDFTDPDWLDSSFLFYDEEARLVRISVRDVLHTDKLRYTYGDVGLPWLDARPPATTLDVKPKGGGGLESVRFPVSLDAAVRTEVRRPRAQPLTRRQKRPQEEVLLVKGIEVDAADFVRFDVYVNAREYHKVFPGAREMAGSFVTLKHPGKEGVILRTSMRVALNELLQDLGAEWDDNVTVTLVPVRGHVTIGGLRIVYMDE